VLSVMCIWVPLEVLRWSLASPWRIWTSEDCLVGTASPCTSVSYTLHPRRTGSVNMVHYTIDNVFLYSLCLNFIHSLQHFLTLMPVCKILLQFFINNCFLKACTANLGQLVWIRSDSGFGVQEKLYDVLQAFRNLSQQGTTPVSQLQAHIVTISLI